MLKLKLKPAAPANTSSDAPPSNEAPTPTSAAPKLKFNLKPSSAPTADPETGLASEPSKSKRKYTKKPKGDGETPSNPAIKIKAKKRPRDETGDDDNAPVPKRKPKPTAKSLALARDNADAEEEEAVLEPTSAQRPPRPIPVRTQSVKLSFKPKGASIPKGIPLLKVKGAGKPPVRPPGVGYDSEAEEAEVDPAIENQFVLRMQPGPDCDLLRKAIEEKTIGKSTANGGPGVMFRFFDREGRRAMITIQGRQYAATMVELPCIIESMKSWNKKDWVKTADICQMLLVLGLVHNEEEAKKYPLPREVNNAAHQYPHGLTPPMQWARKRRFRPRVSYHRIEQVEEETERQLERDHQIIDGGGRVDWEVVNADEYHGQSDSSADDAEGEYDELYEIPQDEPDGYGETPAAEMVDASELEKMLADELMGDDGAGGEIEVEVDGEGDADDLFGGEMEVVAATSHDVAMHALGGTFNAGTETAASTPNAETDSPDADDDDDAESDEDDEVDEQAAANQQQIEEIREQIKELDGSIEGLLAKRDSTKNVILKQRLQNQLNNSVADREVKLGKLRALGVEVD